MNTRAQRQYAQLIEQIQQSQLDADAAHTYLVEQFLYAHQQSSAQLLQALERQTQVAIDQSYWTAGLDVLMHSHQRAADRQSQNFIILADQIAESQRRMTYKMDQTLERLVEVSHQPSRPVTPLDSSQIASGFAAALHKSLHVVTQKLDALGQQFNAAVNFSTPALLQPSIAPSHAVRCEVVAS